MALPADEDTAIRLTPTKIATRINNNIKYPHAQSFESVEQPSAILYDAKFFTKSSSAASPRSHQQYFFSFQNRSRGTGTVAVV